MRLNLGPIRQLVEDLTMSCECTITRDPDLTNDDDWDEDTGTYESPEDDRDEVYSGICTVYPMSSIGQEEERGGEEISSTKYWLGIPTSELVVTQPEDIVEITAVDPEQGDPELVGKKFSIEGQEWNTMASSRRFMMKFLAEVP